MIKDNGRRQGRFRKDLGPFSVIASSGISDCPGNKNSGDGVVARIASGVRIGVKLLDQLDIQGRFLFSLSLNSLFQALPVINEASGQGPSVRRVFPFNQDDAALIDLDDDVDRYQR